MRTETKSDASARGGATTGDIHLPREYFCENTWRRQNKEEDQVPIISQSVLYAQIVNCGV